VKKKPEIFSSAKNKCLYMITPFLISPKGERKPKISEHADQVGKPPSPLGEGREGGKTIDKTI
jgi:hypothetical protein